MELSRIISTTSGQVRNTKKMTRGSTTFLLAFITCVVAYPDFQKVIPNGDRVPSPCNPNEVWRGVGHELLTGPGPLNLFGVDFVDDGQKWTSNLCKLDSDGDGKTNGQELGDPDCQWTPGSQPAVTDPKQLSHPGICEPIDSPACKGSKTDFLRREASCNRIFNVTSTSWCPAIEAPDVKSLVLRFDETTLPALETNYFCQTMDVPNDQDYHIIAWEPIISNPEIMHHLILFICDTKKQEDAILKTGNYSSPIECGIVPEECTNENIAWAFGMGGRCFNPEAGFAMGKNFYRKVILQIHYNNPMLKANLLDSSGIKIYYTTKMRPNHIAHVRVGQGDISIPPGSESTKIIGRSFQSSACARRTMTGAEKFYITSFGMHMHKFGKWARVYIERQNGSKVTLMDEEYFYDRPLVWSRKHEEAIVVYPSDNFVIECTFNTANNANWTFFGKNTADEMCLTVIEMYPRPKGGNFVEFSNFGMLDNCDLEDWREDRKSFCEPEELDQLIYRLGNDTRGSLQSECNNSNARSNSQCCDFLDRNDFLSYLCVYHSSHQIVTRLLGADSSASTIRQVHSNVLSCINSLYQTEPLERHFNGAGRANEFNLMSAIFAFVLVSICVHIK